MNFSYNILRRIVLGGGIILTNLAVAQQQNGSPVPLTEIKETQVMLPSEVPQIKLPQDAPKGEIKEFIFDQSRIFPGTVRKVHVFIPAQYDGKKPACVYIRTDGYRPQEKPLLEGLIAAGKMPVTVGIFVTAGQLPSPGDNSLPRRNRGFEYDGMGDSNARFFLEEILPFVTQQLSLNLSGKAGDRCIAGTSSGGITAFNAAWERPDAFSRVYAVSGSFTAFRGGNEFPVLVRKTEAKPIRVYLTTGTDDLKNCAGDWFLMDLQMSKALKFSGYDSMFRILKTKHGGGFYECYTEAMTFLWKDWPAPVTAGSSAPRIRDVILPDEKWELIVENRKDVQCGTCNASGEIFYADVADNKIYCIGLDGQNREFLVDSGEANGLTIDSEGNIYTVSQKSGRVMQYSADGQSSRMIAEGIFGHSIMAHPNGGLYITCSGKLPENTGTVWLIKDGQAQQVDSGLKQPTGLAYRPDQWLLSVADGASKWAYSYQINPDGTLTNKEKYFWLHVPDLEDDAGAAAVCYAKEGQMFVATRMGIQICADDGPTQGILPMPDRSRVFGICLGGKDGDTLFAFCGDRIWQRKVKVHAVGTFSPLVKIDRTPL